MTEVPEHLLERSRARRAALGGGGDAAAAPATTEGAATPATTASAPAKAAAVAPVVAEKPVVVFSPQAQAELARKKIPWWAAPVLVFLPLWSFLYVSTLEKPPETAEGIMAEGETIYAKCAGCHGATGAGAGAIPGMVGAELLGNFPGFAHQIEWVARGSAGFTSIGTYGAQNRPVAGGMPAWGAELTSQELLSVIYYERVRFGEQPEDELVQLKALFESPDLPASLTDQLTLSEVEDLLAALPPAE